MKAPTIYDVARLAGVSHQTVTRFLQGFEGIRPETRQRVQDALDRLGYRPNSAARYLRNQRINRIGVLAHKIEQGGPARIIAGATAAARARGYVLDIVTMDGDDPSSIEVALGVLLEHQIAGVIATAQSNRVIETIHSRAIGLPLLVDQSMVATGDTVSVNERAGRIAARHLLELGHRRLGYLSGPSHWVATEHRRVGFASEAAAAGATIVWTREGDWSAGAGHRTWQGLGPQERDVTAVAAANDSMAVGLIAALHDEGRRVPDDISVIGTDDMPEARYLQPPLTTVALGFEAEGAYIVERLIAHIEGLDATHPLLPLPELRVRASTRSLRPGGAPPL